MASINEAEARAYLSKKGVSSFVDRAIMQMLHEKPEDPVEWLQEHCASVKGSRVRSNRPAGPGVVRVHSGISWSQLASKLPAGRSEKDKVDRAALFNKIDANQNDFMSPQEAVKGLSALLPFEGKDGITVVMVQAFTLIRKLTATNEVRPPNVLPESLSRPQFRLLLVYLRRYCQLLALFDEFDTDEDRMVDYNEFVQCMPELESWGIRIHYPEQSFKALDKAKTEEVPFGDFAEWVISKQLENEPVSHGDELGHPDASADGGRSMKSMKAGRPMKSMAVSSFRRGRTGEIDWAIIAERMPYGRSKVEVERRKELFNLFDVNGNGYLSLAEVDKGLRDIVKLEEVYDCKPAIMRAFQASKDVHKDTKARLGHDFVTKSEFRILLEYLRKYFELFVMFDRMDDDNDRRLSEEEFVQHASKLHTWGVKSKDLRGEFRKMDTNNGGKVLFDEFCHWAIPQNLDVEDDDDR
uniref:EF-hand domain-containing protein n=1 Tax=Eutreptiella gymnastica TaxID=73025 RepID=A0A7S1J4Z5_9EUGL|mmetsp:Transcript_67569/g.119864  ORF Transcript_67569/g.119864 Transcript_67569/m.119864 type:complete len:467 (+) Transcript_67569:31-1431(+)